jgi:tryptophan synthase alpha chain
VRPLVDLFARTRAESRAALVGYLPAGYPDVGAAVDAFAAMVDAGADIVEVGLPYSDPLMDGPTIQAAVDAALRAGTTTADVLHTVEKVAATGAATLVMSYWNPIERYGVEAFARDLAAAGGVGVIAPDLTPEEGGPWRAAAARHHIDPVFLVAPSSSDARLASVSAASRGFVYAASTMGVTGVREEVGDVARTLVARTRAVTQLPLCVGLGVSTGDQAAEVAAYADGVIVGSAFVRRVLDAASAAEATTAVAALATELAEGVRRRA